MLRFILLLLAGICPFVNYGQSLLLNGGFEEENTCTEFQVECAPEAWLTNDDGFSNYFKDANRAHTGLHCMAIEAGHATRPFKRTFIRSQLVCGLRKGNQYQISFFIKSAHSILDSIGIYFSSYDFLFDTRALQTIAPAAWLVQQNRFSRTDTTWQKAIVNYTASGDESFFVLANFSKKDITGPTGIVLENNFFVYIDDIVLTTLDTREKICADWAQRKRTIYEQNERHRFLREKIKSGKLTLPPVVLIPKGDLVIIDTLVLPDILFASGKDVLQAGADTLLNSIYDKIRGKQIDSLVAEGHTDSTGTADFNKILSLGRAKAVADYFIQKEIVRRQQVIVRGMASVKPVSSNASAAGRQQNRRVELFLYLRE